MFINHLYCLLCELLVSSSTGLVIIFLLSYGIPFYIGHKYLPHTIFFFFLCLQCPFPTEVFHFNKAQIYPPFLYGF